MANDGRIVIDTKLDTKGFEKDVETASKKAADDLGKGTEKAMKQAEESINKIGKAAKSIDFSNIAKQMDNISKSIENTNSKIELQKNKLNTLKKAYESATDVNKKNKIQEQMLNAEASVIKLEGRLNSLNSKKIKLDSARDAINGLDGEFSSASVSAVKSLDKIDKKAQETGKSIKDNIEKNIKNINIGEDISKTGKSIEGVGDKLTTGVTLPILGLGAAAAKIGMDFDSGMSRVKAISGATGQEFVKLHDQALQLGADTAFSAKQAAEGMENLASAGFSTNEIMQAMPGLLDLAASSGESLASSSDIAASTLRGFGLAADQTGHVADVLAKNASATNAAVNDTGEAMKYIAPVAHAMGLSIEEVTAAIGEMANAGIKGSQAGTTLRSALTRLASPADPAAQKMEEIGFKAFDSQGKLFSLSKIIDNLAKSLKGKTDQQKEDAIATIFGQEAMSGMLTLIDNGSASLDDLTNSYKSADGAAKDMAKTMQDNSKSAIEQMTGSLETAAIKLEEVAAPEITKIANEVMDMANRFSELPPSMQESIIQTALFAAAIGPVTKIVGSVTGGIGSLITFGGRLASTLGLLGEGASIGGTALTAFSTAGMAAAGVAGALVVGIAGAVTYNELLEKSVVTSTDDLNAWERAVNACTGSTIKSKAELQKAGLIYKDFGEGVSDSFKEGIEKATKQYHDLEVLINQSNIGDKITEANKGKIASSINSLIDEAKSAVAARKGELQKELTEGMLADDGIITKNEQKVLDILGRGSDEKLAKINEIQGSITERYNKAISEHGKLTKEDIEIIQNWIKQIQQIKAEALAKNEAESTFAKNNFAERLNGISAEDASKEYTDASKTIHDNYSKLKATYKTEIDDLNLALKKARDEGKKEDVVAIEQEINDKNKAYDKSIKEEQGKRKELLDMLYKKNPTLDGTLNEVDGSLFSKADYNTQEDLSKIKQEFSAVADATESGMKRVQDSTGKWHDIYVTVDQATGNITSAYDAFTGEYGAYSEKFANDAKATGDKVKTEMQSLYRALNNSSGIKLDGNNVFNASTDALIGKLNTIIEKANGTKVAIANINGAQVKLEFDKDGTLTNYKDVLAAINGQTKDNPAVVNVDVNDKEALEKFKETEDKADELSSKTPTVETSANTEQANSNIDTTSEKVDNLNGKEADVSVNAETSSAQSNLDSVWDIWSQIINSDNVVVKTIKTILEGSPIGSGLGFLDSITHKYTGTGGDEGLTTLHEHGWEMTTGENELYYLGGGTGILDHGSSVNAMQRDVDKAVNNKVSQVVSKLISALGGQNTLLNQVAKNTLDTANSGKEGVKVNQKLATDLISNISKSTTGTFSNLQNEITSANDAKAKVDKMKVEDNANYARVNQIVNDLNNQIEELKNKSQDLSDSIGENASEATKKSIQAQKKEIEQQQHVLEKKKDIAEKEKDIAKEVAENEIARAKESAEQQVKIAEEKKEKLTRLAEAVTEALKTELEGQKAAAEKSINNELAAMEKSYNSKIASIEAATKNKADKIDEKIKALEKETTENSRDNERTDANNNIYILKTKKANTASEADKRALALQIKDAEKALEEKEDTWNIEDQKAALEEEKALLQERADNRKKSLEEQYNREKEEKEQELKDTNAYYDKLLEQDSINAQARYMLLQGNQEELVALLQSYNPLWQDAGQSLADSLLTGLNSQKESIQQAVNDMLGTRTQTKTSQSTDEAYYYENGQKVSALTGKVLSGYGGGTSFNPVEGYYLTNEEGPEMSTSGDVAYVSKGAAIKNAMQTKDFIASEISRQVGLMRTSVQAEQANMQALLAGSLARSTSNTTVKNETNNNAPLFYAEHVHFNNENDIEQMAYKLGFYATRNKVN